MDLVKELVSAGPDALPPYNVSLLRRLFRSDDTLNKYVTRCPASMEPSKSHTWWNFLTSVLESDVTSPYAGRAGQACN